MDADRYAQATALFHEALEVPTEQRSDWLATVCPDTGLRSEVQTMLDHQLETEPGLLDAPLLSRQPVTDALVGETVGPWRITGVLGAGGMGTVYRAERDDATFEQSAALKLVRPGLGAGFEARFVRERALLAGLDHPGVARLLDGGVTANGAPYLALERVEGEPITTYAETRQLDVPARLALFLQACKAVAYAHRSLVVHRDLKPAHIVVTEDGAQTKLLDFGIAKLLDAEDELLTQTGGGPMTPAYAAPEQVLRQPVTTATDVYALGVVLYELLTGQRPYRLSELTAAQMEQVICETDPPRPSDAAEPSVARQLDGDLDAIVLRAMAKEPERRYASADALADDLKRHLDGLPVVARPPTAHYRLSRFIRRHRAGVVTTLAVIALIATLIGIYTVRLGAERDRARQAALEAATEAERAEAVAGFLEQLLRAPNTRWYNRAEAKGPDTPVRMVLDEAATRLDRDFADQPDLRADLHHVLGDTYLSLGLATEAGFHHERVLALRESLYTPPHPKLAEALYYAYPFGDTTAEQLQRLRRAVEMQRQRNEGNNFPFMVQDLGGQYQRGGRPAEAAPLFQEAFTFVTDRFVPGHEGEGYRHPILMSLSIALAETHLDLGDIDTATRWLAVSDSVLARLPREASSLSFWRTQMCTRGTLFRLQDRQLEAERALRSCLGEGPPTGIAPPFPGSLAVRPGHVQLASYELVRFYESLGRPDAAAPYRDAAARHEANLEAWRAELQTSDASTPQLEDAARAGE
ncbi:MAG: hypothetical protein Rubg2KO_33290 [Rubricoccaceae bacterium]